MSWKHIKTNKYVSNFLEFQDLVDIGFDAISKGYSEVEFDYSGGSNLYGMTLRAFQYAEETTGVVFKTKLGERWVSLI